LIAADPGVSFGCTVMKPTRLVSLSGVKARLAALLIRARRVR
jgi:hypothetical protein